MTELPRMMPSSKTEEILLGLHNRRIAQMEKFTQIEREITNLTHEWHQLIMEISHCEHTRNWTLRNQLQKRLVPLTQEIEKVTQESEREGLQLGEISANYRQASIALQKILFEKDEANKEDEKELKNQKEDKS